MNFDYLYENDEYDYTIFVVITIRRQKNKFLLKTGATVAFYGQEENGEYSLWYGVICKTLKV